MFVLFRNYIYISKKKNYESETGSRNINFLRLQEEWDLGVKSACNTTVHTSTVQTPFFATFSCEATVPVHLIYTVLKASREIKYQTGQKHAGTFSNSYCLYDRKTASNSLLKCSILQDYQKIISCLSGSDGSLLKRGNQGWSA